MQLHCSILSFLSIAFVSSTLGAHGAINSASPSVTLDEATVHGVHEGGTNSFLGIPYAQPP